jgi:ELWxxDGT repeat protein
MKKNLLAFFVLFTLSIAVQAQVTRLSNNTNLLYGAPINASKAIFLQPIAGQADFNLYVTDGTAVNTVKLNIPVTLASQSAFAFLNNKLYFTGLNAANGAELWVTDGTDAGTALVKDINPGAASSLPRNLIVYNNEIYFYANTPAFGEELWKSNGTESGTVLVKDINEGTAGSYSNDISYSFYKNEIYFSAVTSNGLELWKTNGTGSGTVLIKDINPGAGSSAPQFLPVFNNLLFFTANNGTAGSELWKTDGTEASTTLVADIAAGAASSQIQSAIPLGDRLLFNAEATAGNKELFAYSAITGTVSLVKEINPGATGSNPDITSGININNKIIFAATNLQNGRELWITDGTENGTTLFKDINPGFTGSNPGIWLDRNFFAATTDPNFNPNNTLYNGKIFFIANNLVGGLPVVQLWITDGTPGNTILVKDFGFGFLIPSYFYTQSGLYFDGTDNDHGIEVWKSQGTLQTTNLYADVRPGVPGSNPFFQFFILNGKVFFTADDGDSPNQATDLYVLSGNESVLPLQFLQFAAAEAKEGVQLNWTTSNERNTKNFEVQRSVDGSQFVNISTVTAAGQTSASKDYTWLDKEAYSQKTSALYYRLRQVDNNGAYNYSKIAIIQLAAKPVVGLQISPNPATSVTRLNFTATMGSTAQLRIFNSNGQIVKSISTRLTAGNNQQVISLDGLAPGVYQAELITPGKAAQTVKFIKQ